jgi:AraC-like DNA-binding protein
MNEIQNISKYTPMSSYFGSDYCFATFDSAEMLSQFSGSVKIEGATILLCTKGTLTFNINFSQINLSKGCLTAFSPGDYLQIVNSNNDQFLCHVIYLSKTFLSNLNIDPNVIDYRNISSHAHTPIQLDDQQLQLINQQFDLLNQSTQINTQNNIYTRNVARALISAIIYQLLAFLHQQQPVTTDQTKLASRRNTYVQQFLILVKEHFQTQHAIDFYANQLFISPKYLSMIVKEATGATATEWIDRHIILEAKNQLRFSGKNIQQIAYALNFANQSSFGKYFKHHTNLSPSQYRKT